MVWDWLIVSYLRVFHISRITGLGSQRIAKQWTNITKSSGQTNMITPWKEPSQRYRVAAIWTQFFYVFLGFAKFESSTFTNEV